MRDISPAAKHMSANILNWLGYSHIAATATLFPGKKVKRRRARSQTNSLTTAPSVSSTIMFKWSSSVRGKIDKAS